MPISDRHQDLASKEASLHQKYIELLEKRVAQLETVVKQGDETQKAADSAGDKAANDKEQEDVRTWFVHFTPKQP